MAVLCLLPALTASHSSTGLRDSPTVAMMLVQTEHHRLPGTSPCLPGAKAVDMIQLPPSMMASDDLMMCGLIIRACLFSCSVLASHAAVHTLG